MKVNESTKKKLLLLKEKEIIKLFFSESKLF
jgi:hypothetical protein